MSLVVTPAYTWTDGDLVTATRLTATGTPTIADGQAGVFSTISASGSVTLSAASAALVFSGATLGQIASTSDFYVGVGAGKIIYSQVNGVGITAVQSTGLSVTGSLIATGLVSSGGNLRMAADVPVSASVTPVDLTGLSLALSAATTYSFRAKIFASTSGLGGYLLGIYASGGLTATSINGSINFQSTTGTGTALSSTFASLNSGITPTTSGANQGFFYVDGTITVNVAGTLVIRGAQSAATGTTTFLRGSFMQINTY